MEHILAGIVLYNAEIHRLIKVVNSILSQVELVCLCDNASNNITEIERLFRNNKRIIYIKNSKNLGLGTAANQICRYAKSNNFNWVLLLDQDTICPSNLIETYKQYTDVKHVGIICPNVMDKKIVNNAFFSEDNEKISIVKRCIQSASLINLDVWNYCGGYNEWMFIDFIDFDFCKKLEINGYKIIRCNNVIVDHQFGKKTATRWADLFNKLYKKTKFKWLLFFTYNNEYSYSRVYYSTRNNIAYIKIFRNYINLTKEITAFFDRVIRRILRGNNKPMIISGTIKGIIDGIKTSQNIYE